MSTLMKQGLLSWSHRHPHSLCRFFPTAFRAPQYAKPISPCTVFDTLNRTNLRRESKDGVFKQEVLTVVDFEEKVCTRFPATALIMANALMFTTAPEALAETCVAENSVFNMPLLLFVALIGATVGGLLARQRKEELQRLNEQLRQINAALRRQAKIESYAPSLSYAPVSGRIADNEVIVDSRKQELITHLKNGKNFLRNQGPERAFSEFKSALELAQNLKDPIEEKKAARGLGASLQRQGKYKEAIKYHTLVLEISQREGEESGNTEAYGAIADCYTELGDLERAAKYYDQYIARLESD
ncbi:protein FLUORESCENT IN BLUE LIGHT, chloroplastic [Olea europaea var. sylvestris]|uniref:protein FLUORESCENT IN BLUE LIGHT, chloroplastic n=1 Tax=Olea europaea var. sylvestris TaxID=158386 RepID=UPI000C1D3A4E|nr:protein FLUORESCENT IN BLUE LIGHT, chloroplastic [Olea europaea var. sylvestris]